MWIRTYFPEIKNFEWQQSDFAFSVSSEHACCTIDTKTIAKFPEKIRLILDENELEYDPAEILEWLIMVGLPPSIALTSSSR